MSFINRIINSSLSRACMKENTLLGRLPVATRNARVPLSASFASDSITYSGGQATEGQGGYYGSGGSRKLDISNSTSSDPRPQLLALAADVTNITNTMKEVETLEQLLLGESKSNGNNGGEGGGAITNRIIEIKSKIKKACTNPEFLESLSRLEFNGEPKWGLSTDEREMIFNARTKVNEC